MKKLWILAVLALGIAGSACNQGDPEPVVGDAPITKDMPENQPVPRAGQARANAPGNAGKHRGGGTATPP